MKVTTLDIERTSDRLDANRRVERSVDSQSLFELQNENARLRRRLAEAEHRLSSFAAQASDARTPRTTDQAPIDEEHYRTLFHSIDEGFCVLELLYADTGQCVDYRFAEVNQAFERHSGLSNALNRTILELVPEIEREWLAIYDRVLQTGEPLRFVNESQEMERWYSVYAFRLGPVHERRVALLFTDITQQRQAEISLSQAQSRLDSTLAAAEIGTWEFDLANNRVWADANLARMFGARSTPDGHAPLESFLKVIHQDDRANVEESIRRAVESSDTIETSYRIALEGQPIRHVTVRGRIERNAEGRAIRLPGVAIDTTAQRIAEQSLRQSEQAHREIARDLAEADRRKDLFLATLAHELRNPLSPIKAAAQMLQADDENPHRLKELSALIERQADQMVRLIDDLMDVSRISRGKLNLQLSPVDVQGVINDAIETTSPFIHSSQQNLHIQARQEPLYVQGDAARLTQVVSNLLNNAAKYTPAAGDIWLSVHREADQAVIAVRDNGIGLDEASRARVFEMFEQVDASKERGQSGLGIGLSLAKTLVHLHAGSISVSSPGLMQGCCFEIRLPLLLNFSPPVSSATPHEANNECSPHVLRILVVEDTRAIRFVLRRMLEKMGHVVMEAVDGGEGIRTAIEMQPDLIFSDISMPVMNGHELARAIRSDPRCANMKLVAVTGFGQAADRQNAIAAGFDEHIVKPIDIHKLRDVLGRLN